MEDGFIPPLFHTHKDPYLVFPLNTLLPLVGAEKMGIWQDSKLRGMNNGLRGKQMENVGARGSWERSTEGPGPGCTEEE